MLRIKMRQKGFTLIELLIVIAVIAVLVAILIPNIRSFRTEANKARAQGDLDTLKKAVLLYISKAEILPNSLDRLTETGTGAVFDSKSRVISSIPDDPFNAGNRYKYEIDPNYYGTAVLESGDYSQFNNFVVYSVGPISTATPKTGTFTWGTGGSLGTINLNSGDDIVATEAKVTP